MEMLKRTIAMVLAVILTVGMLPMSVAAEEAAVPEEMMAEEVVPETEETAAPEQTEPPEETEPEETAAETTVPTEREETLAVEEETLPENTEAEATVPAAAQLEEAASTVKNEQYLQEVVNKEISGEITLDADVVMKNDFTLPGYKIFHVAQGVTLTVSSGTTLNLGWTSKIDGSILVEDGGTLVMSDMPLIVNPGGVLQVEQGGTMYMHYDMTCYPGGTLDVQGTCVIGARDSGSPYVVTKHYENGVYGTVSGFTESQQELWYKVLSESDLQHALGLKASIGYSRYIVNIFADITLSRDHTIPNQYIVNLSGDSVLTVPAGCKITNNGGFQMEEGTVLHNNGTWENNGSISMWSQLENNGVINQNSHHLMVYYGGVVNNYGTIHAYANCYLTVNSGAFLKNYGQVYTHRNSTLRINGTWEGDDPISMAEDKTEAYLQELINSGSGSIEVMENVVLEKDFEISGDFQMYVYGSITVPSGKTLTIDVYTGIGYGGMIRVEQGGRIIIKGEIWCSNGSTLDVAGSYEMPVMLYGQNALVSKNYENGSIIGTVNGIAEENQTLHCYVYTDAELEEALAMMENGNYGQYILQIHDSVTLSGDVTIPENCITHLESSELTLTIPASCKLTNHGSIYIWERQTLDNSGTIDNRGGIYVYGRLVNRGSVDNRKGRVLDVFGTWEGNAPIQTDMTQKELEAELAAAKKQGTYVLKRSVRLERDLEVDGVALYINNGGSLVVPDGVALTVNQNIYLNPHGALLVEPGGRLNLNVYLHIYEGAELNVQGLVTFGDDWTCVCRKYDGGWDACTIVGIPTERQAVNVFFRGNQPNTWGESAAVVEDNPYGRTFMMVVEGEITLPRDMTLPEKTILHVDSRNATLVVPEDVTLKNYGQIYVWGENVLNNYGVIENDNYLYVAGSLNNHGRIDLRDDGFILVDQSGHAVNHSEVNVYPFGDVGVGGTWEGNEPVYHYMNQNLLEKALQEAAEMYRLTDGVKLWGDMVVDNVPLFIGNGGHLVVSAGTKLTVNSGIYVTEGGILEVEPGGTLVNNSFLSNYFTYTNGSGYIGVEGSYVHGKNASVSSMTNGSNPLPVIDGIAGKYVDVEIGDADQETLLHGASLTDCRSVTVILTNMTLDAPVTIPQNMTLIVNPTWDDINNATHNDAVIFTENADVVVNGTMWVNRYYIYYPCTLINKGRITVNPGGVLNTPGYYYGNAPINNGGVIAPYAQSITIEGDTKRVIDVRQENSVTLKIFAAGENVLQYVTWKSSDESLVDPERITYLGDGTYHVPFSGAGEVVLTAVSIDGKKTTDKVTLVLERADWSPRLGSNSITIDPMQEDGVEVPLRAAYGNEIVEAVLSDSRFRTEYDAQTGILTIAAKEKISNGKISTTLTVQCQAEGPYTYDLKLTVKNAALSVSVKQSKKLDLFYTDSEAPIAVTVKNEVIEEVTLTDTNDFWLEDGVLRFTQNFIDDYRENPALKPDTKATLEVYLEGYQFPVTKAITIGTTTGKVSLSTDPGSGTVNTALSQEWKSAFHVYNKTAKAVMEVTEADIQAVKGDFVKNWDVEPDGKMSLTLAKAQGGTAEIYVRLDNWMKSVKLTHKVSVNTKTPTVKLGSSALKLSSCFPEQTAQTGVTVSHSNVSLRFGSDNQFTCTGNGEEAAKLKVFYDGEKIVAQIRNPADVPQKGKYTFTAVPVVGDTQLKAVTVKVEVSNALPKAKLSKSSVKLNTQIAGKETAEIPVTLTNKTGYALSVVGFEGMDTYKNQISMTYAQGKLTVKLLTGREGKYTYTLTPIVADAYGSTAKLASVTLTVQSYDKNITVSQSGKGKLDAINPDSAITYTISKIANALGSVEQVALEQGGAWFELTQLGTDAKGKQTFSLKLKEDVTYSTKESYVVQFAYTVGGKTVLSKALTVKVTQSALKASVPAVTYYKAQNLPLQVEASLTSPAAAKLGGIAMHPTKTTQALRDAIGSVEPVWSEDGKSVTLFMEIRKPELLAAGKSYKMVLEVIPKGHAQGAKTTLVTVTVKIEK